MSKFEQLSSWVRSLSILERSPSVALLAGVWLAAGATTAAGFYLGSIADKEQAVARTSKEVFQAFDKVKLASQNMSTAQYEALAQDLNSRFDGLTARADKQSLRIEVKAAEDYSVFEQALAYVASQNGPVKYKATELCTGVGQCRGAAFAAQIVGQTWGVKS